MIKKLLIALGLLVCLITVCFFWQERIDFSKPINHEKFNAYFASIGALGTAFSLFLIYRQILIMEEANKRSFAPNVCAKRNYKFQFSLSDPVNGDKDINSLYLVNPTTDNLNDERRLRLKNYGKGVAHDVRFTPIDRYENVGKIDRQLGKIITEHVDIALGEIGENQEYTHDWSKYIEYLFRESIQPYRLYDEAVILLKGSSNFYLVYSDIYNNEFSKEYKLQGVIIKNGPDYQLHVSVSELF